MTDARASARLTREHRLRSGADFAAIFALRQAVHTRELTLCWRTNELPHSRLGLSVSRRHGNAVRRNRIKRILREVFRQHRDELPFSADIIAIPRRGEACADFAQCHAAFSKLARKLARKAEETPS